jgi:(1->4)-alpha-D-glucan 1-alpha-D-glucosylmutase
MSDPRLIEWLRQLRGIEREYVDFRGVHRQVPDESLRKLLGSFSHSLEDEDAVLEEARTLSERDWRRVLPPVLVLRPSRSSAIPVTLLHPMPDELGWRIDLEEGGNLEGACRPDDLSAVEEQALEDLHFCRVALELPRRLPHGYHRIWLTVTDGAPLAESNLIVVPEQCYEPPCMSAGARLWGLSVQLYSLRSERNWGIGDFTDLADLVSRSARIGVDVIGLNPLHALFPADPAHCSPYGPASRLFLNPIYVDPESLPEYERCIDARQRVASDAFQRRLAALREETHVDYVGVSNAKDEVLRLLHREFEDDDRRERKAEFECFLDNGGNHLKRLCIFYALQDYFTDSGRAGGWLGWPEAYKDPESESVAAFAADHRDAVRYHGYLQWVAHEQLTAAETVAAEAGMEIGLYRDLAVGVNGGGADTWADPDLYVSNASVGAPPDPLALQGQDWGIPPMRPDVLREQAYQPFVELLRANMGHGGALRIDHVMALYRLWWVPEGRTSAEGAYVYYDLDALMGILALESQRHRCLVIGEDLGTVPDAIRYAMPDYGVYSYRVFYFEEDPDGMPRRPENYPERALVTVSTHDLPPLASYWAGTDIELRKALDLYPDDESRMRTLAERSDQRRRILEILGHFGLYAQTCADTGEEMDSLAPALRDAVHLYLAGGQARLMVVQPEDLLHMQDPVNVPGTSEQYPNWRRKLNADLEDWIARDDVVDLAERISARRRSEG